MTITDRDPIEEEGGLNKYAFTLNNSINFIDKIGLKTSFALYITGVQVFVGGWGGTAYARTDCIDNKYYEAWYAVLGTGLGLDIEFNIGTIGEAARTLIAQIDNAVLPPSITTDHDVPPLYLSYIENEALSLSMFFRSFKIIDNKWSPYDGGIDATEDTMFNYDKGWNFELGAGVYNLKGFHFIRTGMFEHCCNADKEKSWEEFIKDYDPSYEPF